MSVFRCNPDESAGLAEDDFHDEDGDRDDGMSDPDNYYEFVIKPRQRREREQQPFATYTLQVIGPPDQPSWQRVRHPLWQRVTDVMKETEQNIGDLLPYGYSVRIREWDAKEEE